MNQSAVARPWPSSRVRVRLGAVPRTLTRSPSPNSRLTVTPGTRCKASATFLSGNLPTSSAVIESTTASALRLVWIEASCAARMPVTTSSPTVLSCAAAGWAIASASRLAEAIIMVL